jgi:DNA replication and repair protein RecF
MVLENEQVLITAAVAEDIPTRLISSVFNVSAGTVVSAGADQASGASEGEPR